MLTLATNLLLWLLAVTNDSMHHEIETELSALMEKFSGTEETMTAPQSLNVHTHTHTHACTLHSPQQVRLNDSAELGESSRDQITTKQKLTFANGTHPAPILGLPHQVLALCKPAPGIHLAISKLTTNPG